MRSWGISDDLPGMISVDKPAYIGRRNALCHLEASVFPFSQSDIVDFGIVRHHLAVHDCRMGSPEKHYCPRMDFLRHPADLQCFFPAGREACHADEIGPKFSNCPQDGLPSIEKPVDKANPEILGAKKKKTSPPRKRQGAPAKNQNGNRPEPGRNHPGAPGASPADPQVDEK